MCESVWGSQRMNSVLVLSVQARMRAVSIVMGTHGLQGTALSHRVCVCVCFIRIEKTINLD